MSGAITAIATAASAAAANAAAFLGASSAVIEGVSTFAYTAATIGVTTGISAGIGAAFAPKVPDPQALQTPLKQPMPVRQSAFGRVRVGGAYAYFGTGVGTAKALSIDMVALLDGRSSAFVSYYLNDDLMAPVGDYWWAPGAPGKYGGGGSRSPNLVQIDSRIGIDTEIPYSEITPALPLWDSTHRGDGVTHMALYCTPARREDQSGDFPNGVPIPSAVIDAQLLYDPRDGGQTQGDKSTYVFSDNPVLCLLAYLTDANGGMGLDYARFILPAVDDWTAAADECDGLVSTSGMHATLLDAAAVGDNKIFVADTTGLSAGVVISLPTEDVTVSSLGLAGEVDLTGDLLYAHAAGELAYWAGSGQASRYRCAGTYSHATPPGDVVKSILSTFDGWLGQRGDGALVPRTNTLYAPTVTLGDRHINGYVLNNYLPDEQATNQYIVSYTDPAAAFNKAEAGYVQDDIDIAARGQLRSQELYLQWVPSGPQAVSVARAMLSRSTQPLRGTVTCNLAGLAAMGERYIGLQISELPDLTNTIVEVTGKVSIDLASMTVSFPFVATSGSVGAAAMAVCIALDLSFNPTDVGLAAIATAQAAISDALAVISEAIRGGAAIDLCVVSCGHPGHVTSNITRRAASASDVADVDAWQQALTYDWPAPFVPLDAMTAAGTFFAATAGAVTDRRLIIITSGDVDVNEPSATSPAQAQTAALAAGAALAAMSPAVAAYVMVTWPASAFSGIADYSADYDNTSQDGVYQAYVPGASPSATLDRVQQALLAQGMVAAIEGGLYGSSSTPGSSYTLPTLAPPSGSPLQPLDVPTIISVTPDYSDSGGGVSGARLSIEVDDPGFTVSWKLRWKLSADALWTVDGGPLDAEGSPLTILSGFVAASGAIDVQVAEATASQVSDWSATTSVTVAAAVGSVSSTSVSAGFTTTAAHNVYYVDTSAGAYTVTLNAAPAADETVEVWDATGHAGTNPISFDGNGNTIAGSSAVAAFININFGHARLIYDGAQWLMQ